MAKALDNTVEGASYRYWAFISYSSRDRSWARWLHRAIETYGIPAQLVRHDTPAGEPAPKRFHPLFHDRAELPASSDLGAEIEAALRASRYLIVVCSPHAAQSHWVNKEVKTFHSLGRHHRVLAVIVDGAPNTGDERECFPPALRAHEPIAADARPEGDGKTNAKLKLLAGMLGVNFDALKQRDAHRKIRQLQMVVAASLVLAAGLGGLAWYASHQREKAVRARQQAESILEFLLYDLRDKLAPLGRLDIIRDVQTRVDRYYEELGVEREEARMVANRAAAHLNDGDRLFSEGRLQSALDAYRKSMQLVQRLVATDPSNTRWQDFLSECKDRVGGVLLAQGDPAGALSVHRESLRIRQWLVTTYPSNMAWQQRLSWSHDHVGDVMLARGDLAEALRAYREALAIRQRLANDEPGLVDYEQELLVSLCRVAGALERQLDPEATQYWRRVFDVLSEMKRRGVPMSAENEKMLELLKRTGGVDRGTTVLPHSKAPPERRTQ